MGGGDEATCRAGALRRRTTRRPARGAARRVGGDDAGAGKKTVFLSHLYIKMLILPRQARDKHRKALKKRRRFLAVRQLSRRWALRGKVRGASEKTALFVHF
eukprot:COSAG06_NODE_4008_length_4666_cov_3.913072_6_plen_102_part_00